jgi:hypothetical protein
MEQFELQRYVVEAMQRLQIPYFITGSIASIFFGEARFTHDIDVVADVIPDKVKGLVAEFPPERFYVSEDAIRQALQHHSQFNILEPGTGLKVDVMIPTGDDHDRERFRRRVKVVPAPNLEVFMSSPEDLILKKMEFYEEGGSDKHLRDIAGMLKISGKTIDRTYINDWADRLGLSHVWQHFSSERFSS